MIRVVDIGLPEERFAKIVQSINFSPIVHVVPVVGESVTVPTTASNYGGMAVDRAWFKMYAPDSQWVFRAAGIVDAADANGVTVSLVYRDDAAASIVLTSATWTGAGATKRTLGPVDLFATGGIPQGEAIPLVRLQATKLVSGTAVLAQWCIWMELRPRRT